MSEWRNEREGGRGAVRKPVTQGQRCGERENERVQRVKGNE